MIKDRVKNVVYPNGQKEIKIYLDTIIHNPTCHIVGRENEILKIEEAFKNNNIVCLSGVGGIGKSELSREFAKRKELNTKFYFEIISCLASDLFNLKDYEGAIKENLKCLEFLKSIKQEHTHSGFLVIRRLGIDYIYNKTYEDAKKTFRQALEMIDYLTFEDNVADFEKSRIYTHLGDIAIHQNNQLDALKLYQKAYEQIKGLDEYLLSQGVLCLKIADLKAKNTIDEETLKYYRKAFNAFKAKSSDEETIIRIENILKNSFVKV